MFHIRRVDETCALIMLSLVFVHNIMCYAVIAQTQADTYNHRDSVSLFCTGCKVR